MSKYHNIEGYEPLFELGLYKKESPGCRILPKSVEVDPIVLAGLVVALFETAMRELQDSEQILFEQKFYEAFTIMMEERFDYEVMHKYPEEESEENQEDEGENDLFF
jgi:hypothetical protein